VPTIGAVTACPSSSASAAATGAAAGAATGAATAAAATGIGAATAPLFIGYLVDTRGDYQFALTVLAIAALAPALLSFALKRPEKDDYTTENELSRSH